MRAHLAAGAFALLLAACGATAPKASEPVREPAAPVDEQCEETGTAPPAEPVITESAGEPGPVLSGRVVDREGRPVADVTVVATSDALQGSASELTDSGGRYVITGLPPGTYEVTFYYSDLKAARGGIVVSAEAGQTVDARLDTTAAGGEILTITCIGDFGPDPVERNGSTLPRGCGAAITPARESPAPGP